ncbi:MAG: hypothetical protein Q4C06_00480 [Bacillota bacterium]|nr:hypothetical protein [Bacillota bacterium]
MINYICADLKRIMVRLPRVMMTLCVYAVLLIVVAVTYYTGWSSVNFIKNIQQYIGMVPVALGLIELIAVFSDDFKAKTMQVAIGLGISRTKVVLCKLIEMIVLAVVDAIIFAVLALGAAFILDAGLNPEQIREFGASISMMAISCVAYTSLTMIVMFYNQGTGLGRIVYLALSGGVVSLAITLIGLLKYLEALHLDSYTLTHFLSVAKARWVIGAPDIKPFIAILIYVAVSTAITAFLFRKRELEF